MSISIEVQGKLYIAGLENKIRQLEDDLAKIKQQFLKYESSDEYELDMMFEYQNLRDMILAIKEQQ